MYNIGVALMYAYSGNSTTVLCSISMEKNILGEMKKHIYIPTNIWDIGLCSSFSINSTELFIGDYACLRNKFQKLLSHEFCVDTLLINHAQDTKITFKFSFYQRVPVYYSLLHKVSFALKDSGTSEGLAYPRPINFYSNLTPLPCRRKFFGPFPSCS